MSNKKNKLFVLGLGVLLAGSLMACTTVKAVPPTSEYDGAAILLDNSGSKIDVSNNTMKQIYDALVTEGDSNSEKVLNNILVIYSKSVFGDFLSEVKPTMESGDSAKIQALADKYSIYGGSTKKLQNIYANYMNRIMKTFYSYVTNSSYQERSEFIEKKFYDAQIKNNYSIATPTSEQLAAMSVHTQVDGSFHLDERNSDPDQLKDYFQNIFGIYGTDAEGKTTDSYIEIAILPEIYRDELVCEYLYEENYRTLGISYARKVNYIKLSSNSSYPAATKNLITSFCKNVVEKNLLDSYPLTTLDKMIKGTLGVSELTEILTKVYEEAGWTAFTSTEIGTIADSYSGTIYKESTFGGYVSDYLKIYDSTYNNDSDIIKDFTNSGAYTPETGLKIKYQALVAQDNTVSGWYTSTGLTDIPSEVKSRIFNMGVADEVNTLNKAENKNGNYVYYRNGAADGAGSNHYFITPKSVETGNEYPYLISDSGNYYLFDIQEAVKSSKLSKTDKTNYYDVLTGEECYGDYIARAIAGTLSSSDTYKKSSNQFFVKKMALVYHDQYVYDYFAKTFPDLFE